MCGGSGPRWSATALGGQADIPGIGVRTAQHNGPALRVCSAFLRHPVQWFGPGECKSPDLSASSNAHISSGGRILLKPLRVAFDADPGLHVAAPNVDLRLQPTCIVKCAGLQEIDVGHSADIGKDR